ncbi:MAG TPA: hypothetical protein VNX68_08410 [Nitrosopumilaceae archaeon]|nr:hypothetical protein [Nitrosopumilaceae archaeon]
MTRLILALILCLTFLSCEQAKPEKDKERIEAVCDMFMQNFRDGKLSEALQLLKQNSVLASSTIDTLYSTITSQMKSIFPSYGRMLSYEFISERKIKDFIARRFYILKFEKSYLKFDFTFYKNESGWKITSFNYNEDLIELLY